MNPIQLKKIQLTIQARQKTYGKVGLSRLEAFRFGISERKMQAYINELRKQGKLKLIGKANCKAGVHKCNVYLLIGDLIERVSKKITYTVEEVKAFAMTGQKKRGMYKVRTINDCYIIAERGRFAWKIFSSIQNKIVPLYLAV